MLYSCTHMTTVGVKELIHKPALKSRKRCEKCTVVFTVAGPQTWNDLPEDVSSAESLATFRHLKTHLFRKSFPDYLLDIN